MRIRELNGGDCKTYLVVSETTREAALVDPLLTGVSDYLKLLRDERLTLRYAIDTHTHADHISGGGDLLKRLGVEYVMGRGALPGCVSRRLGNNETLSFGDARLDFLETPGHTSDSVSILAGEDLLSGDFLFIGDLGAGRLDLPGGDPSVHYESLKKLDALGDGTRLLPGHDYRGQTESTLGAQRRLNPVLSPRSREAYLSWWTSKSFGASDWMKDVVRANRDCARDRNSVAIPNNEGACAAACAASDVSPLPQISPVELSRLRADKAHAPFILDVRRVEEFESDGHIPGSVLIPLDQLSGRLDEIPVGRPITVVCRSGKRATAAALELKSAGRDPVRVMTGGMLAWREAGL